MSNRLRNGLTVFMLLILTVSAFTVGYFTRELAAQRGVVPLAQADQDIGLFWEAWDLINTSFLGELPNSTEITYGAIRGSIAMLDDPYTVFIEPAARDVERERLQGRFGGIGAHIQRAEESGDIILEPIPGNPAEAAGIQSGDVLLAVDGQAIPPEMTVPEIVDLIKGESGTSVVLTVRHPGEMETVDVEVVRGDILLPSVTFRLVTDEPTVGYIGLSRFSGETVNEVTDAIVNLRQQGATSFVLDLRQNGGGLRDAAVDVANLFLDEGPVLFMQSQEEGERTFSTTSETLALTEPLAVLVDGGTASASEILAGALSDRGRATLIGSQTFGKGSVQLVFELSDGSSVHVTSARWFTPNRTQIDQAGLEPDVAVEQTQEAIDAGVDLFVQRAVEYLQSVTIVP